VHADLDAVANSPILRDLVALADGEQKAGELNPRGRANRDKTPAQRAALETRHAALLAELAKIRARLASCSLPEIGPVVARSVLAHFASSQGRRTLARLHTLGIRPRGGAAPGAGETGQPLAGKSFVITGTLAAMGRDDAFEAIRARGGSVSNSVSRKTTYLVVGAEPGDRKLREAQQHEVTLLDETAFLALLGGAAGGKR
jgi:DNA ligase (NAD+)